jgi:putative ABC transport system ATP-binding protein
MIEVKNLKKTFYSGDLVTPVLKGIDLKIPSGQFVAITGSSGSGKSTFLYLLSMLDDLTEGTLTIDGTEAGSLSHRDKTRFRLDTFGFVFQDYALLPELTAVENVMLPSLMMGLPKAACEKRALQILKQISMKDQAYKRPSQLSGGQQQRVSVARAVAHNPRVLFADEPTANLDSVNSKEVVEVFEQLHGAGQTIILVTHEPELAEYADRILELNDGRIIGDVLKKK